jgi:hypothetical protein
MQVGIEVERNHGGRHATECKAGTLPVVQAPAHRSRRLSSAKPFA